MNHPSDRIADDLRERIKSGVLPSGAQLPTQRELMKTWQTTSMTVRAALDKLTREGLITANRPIGTFVRDPTRHKLEAGDSLSGFTPPFPSLADRFLAALTSADRPATQVLDVVEALIPPAGIQLRMDLDGGNAILRRRMIYVGDTKTVIHNDYYPERLVQGSELARPILLTDGGTIPVLTRLGIAPARLVDEIFVRVAAVDESREMGWEIGAPVLVQMCTAHSAEDVPVACWTSVIPGDSWILAAERFSQANTCSIRAVS